MANARSSGCRPAAARRRPHPRLGAVLTFLRSIPLGEASLVLDASIAGIRVAAAELTARLVRMGMLVIEDGEVEVLGVVINAGSVTGGRDRRVRWRGFRRNRRSARRVGPAPAGGAEGRAPATPSPPGFLRSRARPRWGSCASACSPTFPHSLTAIDIEHPHAQDG